MSASSPIAPKLPRLFGQTGRKPSGPRLAVYDLLSRTRQRLYPETTPVLASYWLKAIYSQGHNLPWWSEVNAGLERLLREEQFDDVAAESFRGAHDWIAREILRRHKAPEARSADSPPFRPDLTPAQAGVALARVLNEWLPGEVAHLLTAELEYLPPDDGGMPVLAVAKAIERLLRRERFSPASLEQLLEPESLSPKDAYPAHVEILRDVVLALLGRTAAPPAPVLPATLLAVAPSAALPRDFAFAVERAFLESGGDREELHVPILESAALELLHHDPVRIGSTVVTMDGRWWQSDTLQGGVESAIVYRPGGRLRIDFTSDHAKLVVPWPAAEASWPGDVHLPDRFELFGREWRGRAWERDADRAWLHLEFVNPLLMRDAEDAASARERHLRPASSEMAWSELEQALAASLGGNDTSLIDGLRREDLIPLAHALRRFGECLLRPPLQKRDEVERSLLSIRYLHGAVAGVYGRIPLRVLPSRVKDALKKTRLDERSAGLFHEVFEDAAGAFRGPAPRRVT